MAVILATVATPVTVAAAGGPHASVSSVRRTLKQIKALKKTTAVLLAEVSALQLKAAELEEREPVVNSLPTGPAGGDLTGTYPNPRIQASTIFSTNLLDGTLLGSDFGPGSVQPSNIAEHTLGSAAIADHAIGPLNLTNASVGAPQLFEVHNVPGLAKLLQNNASGRAQAECPSGERLLGGGAEWQTEEVLSNTPANLNTTASFPDMANPNQWDVAGVNTSGSGHTLIAIAVCLKAGLAS